MTRPENGRSVVNYMPVMAQDLHVFMSRSEQTRITVSDSCMTMQTFYIAVKFCHLYGFCNLGGCSCTAKQLCNATMAAYYTSATSLEEFSITHSQTLSMGVVMIVRTCV